MCLKSVVSRCEYAYKVGIDMTVVFVVFGRDLSRLGLHGSALLGMPRDHAARSVRVGRELFTVCVLISAFQPVACIYLSGCLQAASCGECHIRECYPAGCNRTRELETQHLLVPVSKVMNLQAGMDLPGRSKRVSPHSEGH